MNRRFFCVNAEQYDTSYHFEVYRPASLKHPQNNSVMFIMEDYIHQIAVFDTIKECIIFWPLQIPCPKELMEFHCIVKVENPHLEFCNFFKKNQITNYPQPSEAYVFKDGYCISEKAFIKDNCKIMPYVYIGDDVTIGNNVYIGAGSKIVGFVEIGNNVVIRENTIIGADGLSTDRDKTGAAVTMPQFGGVIIEDDVQIGSNTVIARGAIDNTILRKGAKIDNSVFISHNVEVGENTFIVGETIMFGSSSTGKNTLISGNCTIRNGVNIGDNVTVGMGSVVIRSSEDNTILMGNPAKQKGKA